MQQFTKANCIQQPPVQSMRLDGLSYSNSAPGPVSSESHSSRAKNGKPQPASTGNPCHSDGLLVDVGWGLPFFARSSRGKAAGSAVAGPLFRPTTAKIAQNAGFCTLTSKKYKGETPPAGPPPTAMLPAGLPLTGHQSMPLVESNCRLALACGG